MPPRHPLRRQGERERHRRQEPLGDVGDHDADREDQPLLRAHPEGSGGEEEDHAGGEDDRCNETGQMIQLQLERAPAGLDRLREGCDATKLRRHPGRRYDSFARARDDPRPGEDLLPRLHRPRLARQGRVIDSELDLDVECAVSADPVTGPENEHVAGDELLGGDLLLLTVTPDSSPLGEHAAQGIRGALGTVLLGGGEAGVDEDDDTDRNRKLRHPSQPGQQRPCPEQDREQVNEVVEQLLQTGWPV